MSHNYRYKTGTNNLLRTCVACGKEYPLKEFMRPVSKNEAINLRYARDVPGFTDIYGKWNRGYERAVKPNTRTTRGLKCEACRNQKRSKHHKGSPTFIAVMEQINKGRRKNRAMWNYARNKKDTLEDYERRRHYLGLRQALLDRAAYVARQRRGATRYIEQRQAPSASSASSRAPQSTEDLVALAREQRKAAVVRRGVSCPDKWEMLLTQEQGDELIHAHAAVHWRIQIPEVF